MRMLLVQLRIAGMQLLRRNLASPPGAHSN